MFDCTVEFQPIKLLKFVFYSYSSWVIQIVPESEVPEKERYPDAQKMPMHE